MLVSIEFRTDFMEPVADKAAVNGAWDTHRSPEAGTPKSVA